MSNGNSDKNDDKNDDNNNNNDKDNSNRKNKINGYARLHYLKKLKDLGDGYRTKLNEKNKESRKIKKELFLINNPDIVIKKKGRPKKEITNIILKKCNGRPRKFNFDGTMVL